MTVNLHRKLMLPTRPIWRGYIQWFANLSRYRTNIHMHTSLYSIRWYWYLFVHLPPLSVQTPYEAFRILFWLVHDHPPSESSQSSASSVQLIPLTEIKITSFSYTTHIILTCWNKPISLTSITGTLTDRFTASTTLQFLHSMSTNIDLHVKLINMDLHVNQYGLHVKKYGLAC